MALCATSFASLLTQTLPRRLFLPQVVFGGNGYVGSRVCQQALAMGCGVVSINRSGRPRNLHGDWLDQVEWVQVG